MRKEQGYILEIEIPRLPKLNSSRRVHRWTEIKEKNLWTEEIAAATVGKRPPEPLKRAKVTYIRRSYGRDPDYDNLVGSWKHVQDALIRAGIIVDDTPAVIGQPEYLAEKASPKKGSIVIRVEEIDQ